MFFHPHGRSPRLLNKGLILLGDAVKVAHRLVNLVHVAGLLTGRQRNLVYDVGNFIKPSHHIANLATGAGDQIPARSDIIDRGTD